jgi:hypothetical protein
LEKIVASREFSVRWHIIGQHWTIIEFDPVLFKHPIVAYAKAQDHVCAWYVPGIDEITAIAMLMAYASEFTTPGLQTTR